MHGSVNIRNILSNVGAGFDKTQSASLTDKLRVNSAVRIDEISVQLKESLQLTMILNFKEA